MKLPYQLLWRAACFLVPILWALFELESIYPVYNMPPPGLGVYVSTGSYQWMGRLRFHQEDNEKRLSIVDQLKGSTASYSEREFTTKTSDVIGIWMDITWANSAVIICLLLCVNRLFSSQFWQHVWQIFSQHVRRKILEHVPGCRDHIQEIANRGRNIGSEDPQAAARRDAMPYYWVVFIGHNPGIYTTWEEAEANINRYQRSQRKRYNTLNEAVEALCKFREDRYFGKAIGQSRTQHQASVGSSTSARPLNDQSVVERAPKVRILGLVVIFFLGFVTCILLAHLFDSE